MEDLPLGRIAALVPEYAVKDLPLDRTLMMMSLDIICPSLSQQNHIHTSKDGDSP